MTNQNPVFTFDRPSAAKGQKIGLLGGSFDPPHSGHLHISKEAIKKFDLDQVWWLVSPGNPLKPNPPAAMARRMAAASELVQSPNIIVSDIEAKLGTRYTSETLQRLLPLYNGVDFVWLMGADNLPEFHRWQNWRWIMENVHVGVLARPGDRLAARGSKVASVYHHARLQAASSRQLVTHELPKWCFVNVPMVDASSSELRNAGKW